MPRQIEGSGKWHMTSGWPEKGQLYPVGYCRDHEGHDTAEEAAECYHRYESENVRKITQRLPKCAECGEITATALEHGGKLVHLCGEHLTRSMWFKHTEPTMEGWES